MARAAHAVAVADIATPSAASGDGEGSRAFTNGPTPHGRPQMPAAATPSRAAAAAA